MSRSAAFQRAMLLAFLIMVAYGLTVGERMAASDRVDDEELVETVTTPVAEVSLEEYESYQNETAGTENATAKKIDEYGALILMTEEDGVAGMGSGAVRNGISTLLFPARLSAPWGYEYPDRAVPAARLLLLAWFAQIAYLTHRWYKKARGGGYA